MTINIRKTIVRLLSNFFLVSLSDISRTRSFEREKIMRHLWRLSRNDFFINIISYEHDMKKDRNEERRKSEQLRGYVLECEWGRKRGRDSRKNENENKNRVERTRTYDETGKSINDPSNSLISLSIFLISELQNLTRRYVCKWVVNRNMTVRYKTSFLFWVLRMCTRDVGLYVS